MCEPADLRNRTKRGARLRFETLVAPYYTSVSSRTCSRARLVCFYPFGTLVSGDAKYHLVPGLNSQFCAFN